MTVHRLRAVTDAGTFAIDIDAGGARARLRSETTASEAEQPGDDEGFQLAAIDADIVGVIPDGADRIADAGQAVPLRAHVVANGDTTWVFIDGETFAIEVEPAARTRSRRGVSGNEGLAAPMPATVIKALVEPGTEVHRGDVLLLLEAMKMELPIRAPRDGRVKALHCRPGELVQPGTALVDLE